MGGGWGGWLWCDDEICNKSEAVPSCCLGKSVERSKGRMETIGGVRVIYSGYRGPSVTTQNFQIRSVPSSSKQLGNHIPCTRKQSHLLKLKGRGHQHKKN
jgi:hypothetical protein